MRFDVGDQFISNPSNNIVYIDYIMDGRYHVHWINTDGSKTYKEYGELEWGKYLTNGHIKLHYKKNNTDLPEELFVL